jgi:hypothetical protein
MNLPKDVWQIIFEQLCFSSKICFRSCCQFFCSDFFVSDFLDISDNILDKLNDVIVSNYEHIEKLNASYNENITDAGIRRMQLHTLYASGNKMITYASPYFKSIF